MNNGVELKPVCTLNDDTELINGIWRFKKKEIKTYSWTVEFEKTFNHFEELFGWPVADDSTDDNIFDIWSDDDH